MKIFPFLILVCIFRSAVSDHLKGHEDAGSMKHAEHGKDHHSDHKKHANSDKQGNANHQDKHVKKQGENEGHHNHRGHFKALSERVPYMAAVQKCRSLGQRVPSRDEAGHIVEAMNLSEKTNQTFWVCFDQCDRNVTIGAVLHSNGTVTAHNPDEQHFPICQPPKLLIRHKRHFYHHFRRGGDCVCDCTGDPHFHTFNRQTLNFQNICRYVFVRSRRGNCPFSIEGQNWHVGGNRRVSYLRYIIIKMYNQEYRLLRGLKVKVNGRLIRRRYRDRRIRIYRRGRRLHFKARRCHNIRVRYNGNGAAMIRISRRMARNINGVCGSCDGNPRSDWRTRTGRRVHRRRGLYNAEAIGRSWAVPSDNGRICGGPMRRPPPRRNFCSGARRESAKIQCMTLKRNSQVFKACTRRRVLRVDFRVLYKQCIMDICMMGRTSQLATKVTCDTAQIMADKCEMAGIKIRNWRRVYHCQRQMIKETDTTKPCELPARRGPCRGSHTRYFYNKESGTCRVFNYGGCGGNANRFEKYTDCMTECGAQTKLKTNDCSSTELSVNLMQKLRNMLQKLNAPAPSVSSLIQVTHEMKDVTSQYNLLMKILIEMRKLRKQGKTVKQYENLQQMIASLTTVIKQGINKRYQFPDNKYLTKNTVAIKRVIEKFKVMNNMYTGKGKTRAFLKVFQNLSDEDKVIVREIITILKGTGNLSEEKSEAIKVLVPTLVMSNLEKMSLGAIENNVVKVKVVTEENLQNIQTITQAAEKRIITV